MSRTRRHFLRNTAAAAAALLAAPLRNASAFLQAPATQPAEVNYDTFAPLVAGDFQVSRNGTPVTSLRLVKVNQAVMLKGYRDPVQAARNSFILIFRSEKDAALKEGIYTFSHAGLTPFSAFISPVNNLHTYQIVYNRNSR